MSTRTKIKIKDNCELRAALDTQYEMSSHIKLCQYALLLAKHILKTVQLEDIDNAIIREGFGVNEEWLKGNVRTNEVRQAGFKIHRITKRYDDLLTQTAIRVVGQCIATAHMKEHAMVASDYAIKVINIEFPDDCNAVKNERQWQIDRLMSIEDIWRN